MIKGKKPKNSDYPTEINTLGDHLRARRVDLELTQKQVAERLGVDETTVHNWEIGRTDPAVRLLPAIIQYLGYSPYNRPKSLPARLKAYRHSLGLSQKKLARLLAVDEGSLRSWECGRRFPSKGSVRKLEKFLKALAHSC